MAVLKQKNENGQWEILEIIANDPRIGDLPNLSTNDKMTVVGAINEVNSKLISMEQIGDTTITYDSNGYPQTITTPTTTYTYTYQNDRVTKITEQTAGKTIETTFTYSGENLTKITRTVK